MYPVLFIWRYNQNKKVAFFVLNSDPGPVWVQFTGRGGGGGVGSKTMYDRKTEGPALKANPGHHPSALKLHDSFIMCQSV